MAILLTGCYPTGEKELPSDKQEISSDAQEDPSGGDHTVEPFDGKVSEKIGNVEFNYEISPDFPTQAAKIKLKPKQLNEELVKNVLLRDKTITSESEGRYETSDGCVLLSGFDIIFADSGIGDSRKNFGNIASVYDDFCRSSSEQLKSFPSMDAVERVNKVLDEIGVENYGEPCIIPISPEEGNAYLEEHGGFTKIKDPNDVSDENNYTFWTEDDGIYILKYQFKFNGIDISHGNLKTLETARTIIGADITAYVTKDDIFYLEINSLYDIASLNEETVDLKFDAAYASNALIEHYSQLTAVRYPTFFTECKLEYIPVERTDDNEVIFAPAWCFMGYWLKGVNNDMPEDFAEYYYSETGIRYGSY